MDSSGENITLASSGTLVDCLFSHLCPTAASLDRSVPGPLSVDAPTLIPHLWSKFIPLKYKINALKPKPRIGPLLDAVLDEFDSSTKKLLLVSGHDTGPIGPLAYALGFEFGDEFNWPPFASYVNFELSKEVAGERYVRVVYNGRAVATKFCQTIVAGRAEGANYCRAEDFFRRLRALVPTAAECAGDGEALGGGGGSVVGSGGGEEEGGVWI